jgi:type VI protein secretion system component VasK
MKEFSEYFNQKFHHLLAFLIIGLCVSSVLCWGIKQLFSKDDFNVFAWIVVLFIALFFAFYLAKKDYKNFLSLKIEEKSPRFLYEKVKQSIKEKDEEINFIADEIKRLQGEFTKLKHEKVSLEEKRGEFFKNYPELVNVESPKL